VRPKERIVSSTRLAELLADDLVGHVRSWSHLVPVMPRNPSFLD
jgi:hypothetical protein